MGDNAVVKKLSELLSMHFTEESCIQDFTYPITKEFYLNMQNVLFTKELVTIHRWRASFLTYYSQMQSTPEMYLRYIIYACRQETRINLNIFERFLSVFALILHLRVMTSYKPSVDFQKLIPDIFMAFYERELKKPFVRCGGFRRLVQYINNPKYLALNCFTRNDSSNASGCETPDLAEQIQKKLSEVKELPKDVILEDAETDRPSITLARKIFQEIRYEPSSFVINADPIVGICEYNERRIAQLVEEKMIVEEELKKVEMKQQHLLNLNSDSDTNGIAEQTRSDLQHESIVQKVIKYNRSNNSGQAEKDNYRQKEAWKILDNLENNVKYFLEFLDEYED